MGLVAMLLVNATAFAYSPMVTMSVVDANLGVVLAEVARMGKANIVLNVKPTDTITVTFDQVPFETALYFIARTKGLSIDRKNGNTYVVASQEEMEKGFREVKVFPLKFARADHIKNIIVGGGKTGVYVANLLLANHCRVKVMESRGSVLTKLKDELPSDCIFEGSGTDPNMLEAAGINTTDVLVCATGADETNLVASTIGKFEFNVPRVIARVNNPHNAWMFNAGMGVDVTVNQADLIGHIILEGIDMRDMTTLLKLERGNASIVQIHVSETSSVNGKQIKELNIPSNAIIITIMRGSETIVTKGDTVIHAGDDLLAMADEPTQSKLNQIFHS